MRWGGSHFTYKMRTKKIPSKQGPHPPQLIPTKFQAGHLKKAPSFWQQTPGATVSRNILLPVAMPVLAVLLLPFMNYVRLTLMEELDQLPRQLRDFQVENSECFCCTHHHQHPVTGKELLCDRELIYSTLMLGSTGRKGGLNSHP